MSKRYRITYLIGGSFLTREVNANSVWEAIKVFRDSFPEVNMTEVIEI